MIAGHAGKIGDVVWSLAAARKLGTFDLLLRLRPWSEYPDLRWAESLAPLLSVQPYIGAVRVGDGPVHVNLDGFRSHLNQPTLVHASAAHLDVAVDLSPWLTVEPDPHPFRVLVNRTHRYPNHLFPWRDVLEKYGDRVAFVGHPSEHAAFVRDFGQVTYLPTADMLALAQRIAFCDLFISNQGSPHAVAMGLGKRLILAVDTAMPTVSFNAPNVTNYVSGPIVFPDL